MERVLEVDEAELAIERHLGDLASLDADAIVESGLPGMSHRPRHGIGFELDADQTGLGKPPGDRSQPAASAAGNVEHIDAPRELLGQARQGGEALLEEDGDVL